MRKMISPKPRRWNDKVDYVVVERDGVPEVGQQEDTIPTPTIDQILPRSYTKRQPTATDDADDSDDEDDFPMTSTTATPSSGGAPPVRVDWDRHYFHGD